MALGGTEAKVVGFIHDEFIVETPEENAEVVLSIVVKTMEEAGQQYLTDVPVVAEAVIAGSWAGK
jgi:DNA polymerase I-like protein with 3'-5' exonuclease and polymerase domains